uniref:NADH-ubiquinone oxidoreductase chain 6 n=1 Tax=Notolachesilla sp. GRA1sp1LA TaxID=2597028 RepID=A0A8K1ZFH9_9NEOP|nr:NADH dehydrogenase subunit 6 [Notolachesilla sp. GRA1sp1LA]
MFWIMFMLMMTTMLTLTFFFSLNPLTMGFTLILQTMCLSVMLAFMQKSFWFMYILILIFIGGMLIMFIYMTSILPNEKFKLFKNMIMHFMFLIVTMLLCMLLSNMLIMNFPSMSLINFLNMNENILMNNTIKIFNSSSMFILISLVSYLFYCMIIIIKIINFLQGPLRKMT